MPTLPPTVIATSLKMYFDHDQTLEWVRQVRQISVNSPAVQARRAQVLVFPSFPSLADAARIISDAPVGLGAQHMAAHSRGAFTGEVSPRSLRQVGCSHVEIGHVERRRLFGETPDDIQRKIALALDHDLVPLLCVGEEEPADPDIAAQQCIESIEEAIAMIPPHRSFSMIIAYEPEWAIGADRSADAEYIRQVSAQLRGWLLDRERLQGSSLIYGGSAGPGLLTSLGDAVSGLFLGRFAHDAAALEQILDEV